MGRSTSYQYSPLNQVTKVVDPLGNATEFTYDGNGNLTSLTDALGHGTTYTYDSMDRLATRTDPLGHSESYRYDQNGNVTQFTDRRGIVTTNTYDALNRLAQASFGGQSSVTYAYDAAGRLTQAADSITGTISRGYDALDRLVSEVTPRGSVSYGYDSAGRRTGMAVSGQAATSYTYDNANRLSEIVQGASAVSIGHDADGRRTALTLPNGVVKNYSYDVASQLTGINYQLGTTELGSLSYSYDLAGRRTVVGGSYAQTNIPPALSSASYNADNQLTAFGSSSLTYDSNGNLTSDGTHTYTWDARNHLVSISGAVSASFAYDPFGRRVSKTIGGATTNYLYDGVNPVQELSGSASSANLLTGLKVDEYFQRTDVNGPARFLTEALGSTIALMGATGNALSLYAYDPFGNMTMTGSSSNTYQYTGREVDEYFQRTDVNGPASFLTEALGSTIALMGATGNALSLYAYDPFGNMTMTGSSSNTYQYTGREGDGTGLYYYRARYYSPALQRFLSEDPLGFKDGDPDLYAYVSNNPTNFRDPSGRAAIGAIIGGIVGGIEGGMGARLQGGSTSDIVVSSVLGGLLGAGVGALDPTEGVLTMETISTIGGGAAVVGDMTGQIISNLGRPGYTYSIGEVIGAGIGGYVGGVMGGMTAVGAASVRAGAVSQGLMGGGISAAPSTFGGPIGAAMGPTVTINASGRKDACQQ